MIDTAVGLATGPGAAEPNEASRSLRKAFGRLSLANAVVFAGSIVTGPLLAHALGATGRGTLAAILAPLALASWVAGFGLGPYLAVQTARNEPLGSALGTVALLSVVLGIFAALAGVPIADYLAGGDATVFTLLVIGFALFPLTLPLQMLGWAGIGLSRWTAQSWARVIPAALGLVSFVVLSALGSLTVTSAAITTITAGLLSYAPFFSLARVARPLSFDHSMVRPALRFGARAWIADLGSVTTARVDQLLMVPLVDRRELGLYVVAVTYAALPGIVGSALNTIISPRISQGDRELIGQSLRLTLGFLFASGAALAALAPVVIPFAFGAGFHGSVEMAWVLLVAGVPYGASLLLTSVLTSAGRPGVPALAQGVAAAITLVGLLIVLPTWGAIGAAYVSLVAYSVAMSVMLRVTSSAVGLSLGGLLRPRRSDVASALTALRSATSRRHRREKP